MCGQQIETLTPCKHGNISDSSCSLWLSLYSAHQINFSNRISKFRCQVKSLESGFLMKKTCTNSKNWATYTNFMCLNKFFSHCYNLWFGESHFWIICVWQLNHHLHKFVGIPKSQTWVGCISCLRFYLWPCFISIQLLSGGISRQVVNNPKKISNPSHLIVMLIVVRSQRQDLFSHSVVAFMCPSRYALTSSKRLFLPMNYLLYIVI